MFVPEGGGLVRVEENVCVCVCVKRKHGDVQCMCNSCYIIFVNKPFFIFHVQLYTVKHTIGLHHTTHIHHLDRTQHTSCTQRPMPCIFHVDAS